MPFDWDAAQSALVAWVAAQTGLPAGKVYWADQNVQQPARPYITLRPISNRPVGATNPVVQTFDAGRPNGEELKEEVRAMVALTLSIQAYTTGVLGNNSASAMLSRLRTSLELPAVMHALKQAGLASFSFGSVMNLSALDLTDFEGRAVLDPSFYLTESAESFSGYIESIAATMEPELADPPITFTIPEGA